MKENIFLKNIFHKTKKILGFFYLVPHQTVYFKIPICPSNLWIEQQKTAKSEKGEHVSKIEHPTLKLKHCIKQNGQEKSSVAAGWESTQKKIG